MRRLLWTLLALDLCALGLVLWDGQRHLGQAGRHEEMLRGVGELSTSVALLNEQVLGARAGVVSHYDAVVTAGCAVDAHALQLHSITKDPCLLPAERARLTQLLADLDTVLETQRGLVEHFKSELSVLRNSQRYLPVVVRELSNAGRPGAAQNRRAAVLQDLLHSLLVFAVQPDSADAPRLEDAIATLGSLGEDLAPADRETLALAQRHARVVVERRQMVDGLVTRLLKVPVRDRAQHIREGVLQHRGTADAQAGAQLRLAAGQGGLALLLGLLLLWRPRRAPVEPRTVMLDRSAVQETRVLLGVAVRGLEDAQAALRARDVAAGLRALSQRVSQAATAHGFDHAVLGPGMFLLHAAETRGKDVGLVVRALREGPPLCWEAGEPLVWLAVVHHGAVLLTPEAPPTGHTLHHLMTLLLGGPPEGGVVCTPAALAALGSALPLAQDAAGTATTPLLAVRL